MGALKVKEEEKTVQVNLMKKSGSTVIFRVPHEMLDKEIEELDFSNQSIRIPVLHRNGVNTIGQFAEKWQNGEKFEGIGSVTRKQLISNFTNYLIARMSDAELKTFCSDNILILPELLGYPQKKLKQTANKKKEKAE